MKIKCTLLFLLFIFIQHEDKNVARANSRKSVCRHFKIFKLLSLEPLPRETGPRRRVQWVTPGTTHQLPPSQFICDMPFLLHNVFVSHSFIHTVPEGALN